MLRQGETKYMRQCQEQIYSVIKCIEPSDVTLSPYLAHPFIGAWIYFCSHKISQYPKEDLRLAPKSRKIPMKTDANAT